MKLLNGSTLSNLTAICAELEGGPAFNGTQRFAGSCTSSLPVSHGIVLLLPLLLGELQYFASRV